MKQVGGADQERLLDLALQLMDACRAVSAQTFGQALGDTGTAVSVATQMAVQVVFSAEIAHNRRRGEDEWAKIDADEMMARFHGLGAGVGQAVGSFAPAGPEAQLAALIEVNRGLESAMGKRGAITAQRWKDTKGGRNGPQT